jgi:hypothetical protein
MAWAPAIVPDHLPASDGTMLAPTADLVRFRRGMNAAMATAAASAYSSATTAYTSSVNDVLAWPRASGGYHPARGWPAASPRPWWRPAPAELIRCG